MHSAFALALHSTAMKSIAPSLRLALLCPLAVVYGACAGSTTKEFLTGDAPLAADLSRSNRVYSACDGAESLYTVDCTVRKLYTALYLCLYLSYRA